LARKTKRRDCGFTPKLYAVREWGDVCITECAGSVYGLLRVWRENFIHINQYVGVSGQCRNQSLLPKRLSGR